MSPTPPEHPVPSAQLVLHERLSRTAGLRALAFPAAATWSLAYLGLGCAWLAGAAGNPGDPAVDPLWQLALLGTWGPRVGAGLVTGLAAVGLLTAVAMVRSPARSVRILATALGLALTVAVPDYRLVGAVAHALAMPLLLIAGKAPEGWLWWQWPIVNQALFALAGLAWLVAASEHGRRATLADPGLTEQVTDPGLTEQVTDPAGLPRPVTASGLPPWAATPESAARWSRWAVVVAVMVPLSYAVTRFAWALGYPLGISRHLFDQLGSLRFAGAMLGTLAVGGALLTLGLVQRWGEVFPRWIPFLRGRLVPVGLALVPGYLVSALLASAGLMFIRLALTGRLTASFGELATEIEPWMWVPEMLWPVWGAALATATYLYQVRRRTTPRPRTT